MENKKCTGCKTEKTLDEFHSDSSRKDGLASRCKECKNKERRNWLNREPKVRKKYKLAERYGITYEEYKLYLDKQSCKCAICSVHQDELPRGLYIDHNHDTGEVRGLLCNNCNTALGMLKENVDLFNKAIEYLEINKPYKVSST